MCGVHLNSDQTLSIGHAQLHQTHYGNFHIYTHTSAHAHAHACTRTRTNTHTHTHKCTRLQGFVGSEVGTDSGGDECVGSVDKKARQHHETHVGGEGPEGECL